MKRFYVEMKLIFSFFQFKGFDVGLWGANKISIIIIKKELSCWPIFNQLKWKSFFPLKNICQLHISTKLTRFWYMLWKLLKSFRHVKRTWVRKLCSNVTIDLYKSVKCVCVFTWNRMKFLFKKSECSFKEIRMKWWKAGVKKPIQKHTARLYCVQENCVAMRVDMEKVVPHFEAYFVQIHMNKQPYDKWKES